MTEYAEDVHVQTRAVHITATPPVGSIPAAVPLYQTSLFTFDDLGEFSNAWAKTGGAFTYSRFGNPTTKAFEDTIAKMESGSSAMATASGMGAISAVLLSLLRTGDHVIAQRGLYGGVFSLLADLTERWGIEVTYIDAEDPREVEKACRATTKILYLETIANPMGHVCDLPSFAAAARAQNLITVVDNTFASPVLCQPLRHGADVVVHSTTKYIGGHADVVGGIVVVDDGTVAEKIWSFGAELGASADPFAAWLSIRGLQTLPVRMRVHCENARTIAERLAVHPKVCEVHWPGLPDHRSHEIATELLSDFGGVFAFDLRGGMQASHDFTKRIRVAALAPSLGGVSTTVLHPASISHSGMDENALDAAGIKPGTLRIAVGLEHVEDLWSDLEQALA
ncbi:cystathionine gamma-synthase [Amycolatopsis antarctica]|uniref:homocysteine desulfhydrase n=1 Tax=Amycolatopsis antarctica TaxID=1854586 RepID=A0A263D4A7_9PSEU|nr:aminotransferase class I/II-fold pyridoxal phosphate-dependent enzyme [Amycolatopsis antarctica]OZM73293.1 cystathionine gamma-synthase [Amycolatopsis antarctica]